MLVAGGGISAGQVSLRLAQEGHHVHLVSRHDLRQHQFDSDPGWLGPKFMAGFTREDDLEKRRAIISKQDTRAQCHPMYGVHSVEGLMTSESVGISPRFKMSIDEVG